MKLAGELCLLLASFRAIFLRLRDKFLTIDIRTGQEENSTKSTFIKEEDGAIFLRSFCSRRPLVALTHALASAKARKLA